MPNISSSISIKMADDNFRVQAFAEYCARAQERYSNFVNMVGSIPDHIPEIDDATRVLSDEEVTQIREAVKTEFNIPDVSIAFQSGYTTVNDFLDAVISTEFQDVYYEDLVSNGVTDVKTRFDEMVIPGKSLGGEASQPLRMSISNAGDQIQSNLHSLTCLYAALDAFKTKLTDTSADVITLFNDKLGDVFTNVHADISSSVAYLKEQVLSIRDPNIFLSNIMAKIGVSEEAALTQPDYVTSDCDMSQYTGASPSCALDFSGAVKAATTIATLAAKTVNSIVTGIQNLGKALFNKAASKLRDVLIDPNDLTVSNDSGFGTVEGFRFEMHSDQSTYSTRFVTLPVDWTHDQGIDFVEDLNHKAHNWVSQKTRFGEVMWRFSNATFIPGTGVASSIQLSGIDWIYKPRVINILVAEAATPSTAANGWTSYSDIETFLDNLSSYGSALYDVSGMSEFDCFRGLLLASYLDVSLNQIASKQILEADFSTVLENWKVSPLNADYSSVPSTITNAHWVNAFSGWNTGTQSFAGVSTYANLYDNSLGLLMIAGLSCIDVIVTSMGYEYLYPVDEAPFVPYSNNHVGFEQATYSIKTDSSNQAAFTAFVATAFVITIVAIVVVTAIVFVKKLAKARFFKYAQRQGQLDNAMWNGHQLTKREQRQYIRAKRKVDNSALFTSSLVSSCSSNDTSVDPSATATSILAVING